MTDIQSALMFLHGYMEVTPTSELSVVVMRAGCVCAELLYGGAGVEFSAEGRDLESALVALAKAVEESSHV